MLMTSPLEKLVGTAARALGEEESAVRSRWQLLRKAGLWSRTGRGRTMGYPTAADAGNLLLSFMAGERTTTTGRAVPFVRGARLYCIGIRDDVDLPPLRLFEGLEHRHYFGQVLDKMLDQWSKAGGLESDTPGVFLSNVSLSVDEFPTGFQVELNLDTAHRDPQYRITYAAIPGVDDMRSLKLGQETSRKRSSEGPDLVTRRWVSQRTLAAFAQCLSDGPVAPATDLAILDRKPRRPRRL
jgi:hypothetical protein